MPATPPVGEALAAGEAEEAAEEAEADIDDATEEARAASDEAMLVALAAPLKGGGIRLETRFRTMQSYSRHSRAGSRPGHPGRSCGGVQGNTDGLAGLGTICDSSLAVNGAWKFSVTLQC